MDTTTFKAFEALVKAAQHHNNGWTPDWKNGFSKCVIVVDYDDPDGQQFLIDDRRSVSGPLAFPNMEKAISFIDQYEELLIQAKPLL